MNHLVEEAKQQMSFLSLIITSSFWSPSGEESDELPEDHGETGSIRLQLSSI